MYKFRSDVQEESGSSFIDPHAESSQNYEWWVQHWTEKKKEKQSDIKAEGRRVPLRKRKICTVALCQKGGETVRNG